jgi:trehalose-6-phosphate synthase
MRFTVRLVVALWLASLVVIGAFAYFQFLEQRQRLTEELDRRAALMSDSLKEVLEPVLGRSSSRPQIDRLIKKFSKPDLGLGVYDRVASLISATPDVAKQLENPPPEVTWALTSGAVQTGFRKLDGKTLYIYADPIVREDKPAGALVVFLDASDLKTQEWELWRINAIRFLVLAVVLALMALVVVRMSLTQPLAKMARWTKAVRRGHTIEPPELPDESLFGPIAREVSVLAKNLQRAKAAAEEEAALRLIGQTLWTEERLKQFAKMRLGDRPLVVVSNREPISHVWKEGKIEVVTPASGLVTAMDPVMRACGGVWVAQASGDADRDTADARGRLRVPPDDPRFTLKRVWLTPEEEAGYYYGFSNEGLWPLCHIVHNRPLFRPEDWAQYRAVNEKFAAAVLEEIAGTESPMVLIQDYHFALLPSLIKRERPDARTAIFWHIPWPNFEAFSICPWQDDLLLGMLGADLIGFHTQYYCNNFLDTIERAIEARIDWERFSVTRGQHVTSVKPFPISVAPGFVDNPPTTSRQALLQSLDTTVEFLGVGVERLDYTKGLPERFRALGRFFERFPEYRERVMFVQLAAPSRSTIPRYQALEAEVDAVVQEVNTAYQTKRWKPILYVKRHHEHRDIWPFYRHADFCMVTSLHDGMNLVAKEFISVRDDEDGALILSQFTGASSELRDAILVNPYDVDGMADAIRSAVAMPSEERKARMARMREGVREHNIYRWAGLLLSELERIPEPAAGVTTSSLTS